jgi:hypothetical protein
MKFPACITNTDLSQKEPTPKLITFLYEIWFVISFFHWIHLKNTFLVCYNRCVVTFTISEICRNFYSPLASGLFPHCHDNTSKSSVQIFFSSLMTNYHTRGLPEPVLLIGHQTWKKNLHTAFAGVVMAVWEKTARQRRVEISGGE